MKVAFRWMNVPGPGNEVASVPMPPDIFLELDEVRQLGPNMSAYLKKLEADDPRIDNLDSSKCWYEVMSPDAFLKLAPQGVKVRYEDEYERIGKNGPPNGAGCVIREINTHFSEGKS